MTNLEEFAGLAGTGYESKQATKPEDEFFHSVYIAGQTRKNHIQIEEKAGLLQIRGVQYNLEAVHMVITHVKEVLAKVKNTARGDTIECFSYKRGEAPWYGTSKLSNGSPRPCGVTSAERAANEYCNTCKSQIIIGGIFCEPNGKPVADENQKPVMIFLRGKGTKYGNISAYLSELAKRDLDPIFTPVTDESRKFEKDVVNNKRFLTKITIGETKTNFGIKKVFNLEATIAIPKESVLAILKVAKNTIPKFEEKMDWSKNKTSSSYGGEQEGILNMDSPQGEKPAEEAKAPSQPFNFNDLDFNS
jgi:hypothetical protein